MIEEGKVKDPHPHLIIWLACRNASTDFYRTWPDEGGWLDQDHELTIAFELLDRLYEECKKAHDLRQELRTKGIDAVKERLRKR
jgi:hypothetical protein